MSTIKRVSINDLGSTLTEYQDGSTAFVYASKTQSNTLNKSSFWDHNLEIYTELFPDENWRQVWPNNAATEYDHLIGTEVKGDTLREIDAAGYVFEAEFLVDDGLGDTHRTNADLGTVISRGSLVYRLTGVKKR